jgi:hypothetical protein
VEGAKSYFADGLAPCTEVMEATRAYFKEQRADPVKQWIGEQERCPAAVGTQANELFDAFTKWRVGRESAGSLKAGEAPTTQRAFSGELMVHGIDKCTNRKGTFYGLRLAGGFEVQPDEAAKAEYDRLVEQFGDLA